MHGRLYSYMKDASIIILQVILVFQVVAKNLLKVIMKCYDSDSLLNKHDYI